MKQGRKKKTEVSKRKEAKCKRKKKGYINQKEEGSKKIIGKINQEVCKRKKKRTNEGEKKTD